MHAFGTDNQAAKAAEDHSRGQAKPQRGERGPRSSDLKDSLRLTVERRRFNGHPLVRHYGVRPCHFLRAVPEAQDRERPSR